MLLKTKKISNPTNTYIQTTKRFLYGASTLAWDFYMLEMLQTLRNAEGTVSYQLGCGLSFNLSIFSRTKHRDGWWRLHVSQYSHMLVIGAPGLSRKGYFQLTSEPPHPFLRPMPPCWSFHTSACLSFTIWYITRTVDSNMTSQTASSPVGQEARRLPKIKPDTITVLFDNTNLTSTNLESVQIFDCL